MSPFQMLVAIAMIGLTGCGREQLPVAAPASLTRGPSPLAAQAAAASAERFVAESASFELFVIRSSELALQRSHSRRVQDFASLMVDAHKGTSAQLSLAGRRLNLLPSANLLPREQMMLDSLASSSQFDADYVRDQRTMHQQAVTLDLSYAANGASPTLRPVASAAAAIEQRHLRLVAYL